jgi:hypothetical protein
LSGGGSFETLANYPTKSAGYYNLQLAFNKAKLNFILEGMWGSGSAYVNMSNMTTTLGAQTYSGTVTLSF